MCAFVDHGTEGTGESVAVLLRPGNAGSNTATDDLQVISAALAQIPGTTRGKQVLVRIDGAGGSHKVIEALTTRRLAYSVGFSLPENTPDLLKLIPDKVRTEAYDAHDAVRDGAWAAELTHLMDLTAWPKGMRVIVRKERPHPGAQLRFADVEGMRITAFARQQHTRPARRPRAAPPAPRPLRGPHPHRQGSPAPGRQEVPPPG